MPIINRMFVIQKMPQRDIIFELTCMMAVLWTLAKLELRPIGTKMETAIRKEHWTDAEMMSG